MPVADEGSASSSAILIEFTFNFRKQAPGLWERIYDDSIESSKAIQQGDSEISDERSDPSEWVEHPGSK
ncbi:hypothetical protein HpMS107_52510 [Helicobacter pylori]